MAPFGPGPLSSRRPRRVLPPAAGGERGSRARGPLAVVAASLLLAAAPAASAPARSSSGVIVAKLVWGEQPVERAESGSASWRRLREGEALRTGDHLRTSASGVARLDFPWMAVTLGPSSELSVPPKAVLSTVLERGRAEFSGEGRDIVKIEVGEGEIRGGGRLVLWREGKRTAATALAGAFRVSARGGTVEIRAGEGTTISDGGPPAEAGPLPGSPGELVPGPDPVYVQAGKPAELRWRAEANTHHIEVLALKSDDVLLARNVGTPPARLEIPWLGTFRWRVSSRDPSGVESPPSAPGYVCVVEK